MAPTLVVSVSGGGAATVVAVPPIAKYSTFPAATVVSVRHPRVWVVFGLSDQVSLMLSGTADAPAPPKAAEAAAKTSVAATTFSHDRLDICLPFLRASLGTRCSVQPPYLHPAAA